MDAKTSIVHPAVHAFATLLVKNQNNFLSILQIISAIIGRRICVRMGQEKARKPWSQIIRMGLGVREGTERA